MQGKDLGANEVVTRSNVLGDSEGALAAVCVENLGSPGGGRALVAVLCDLEERARSRGFGVCNLGHVDHDGAVVGTTDGGLRACALVGLGVHFDSEGAAGWRGVLVGRSR